VSVSEHTLLVEAHRQWIKTREPKDGDRFAALVTSLLARYSVTTAEGYTARDVALKCEWHEARPRLSDEERK